MKLPGHGSFVAKINRGLWKLRGDEKRYSARYTEDYFLVGTNPERESYRLKIIRPVDMGAAMCYAFGIDSYDEVVRLLGDSPLPKTDCNSQVRLMWDAMTRRPKLVIDIGCGRGEMSAAFAYTGIKCIGIDPTDGAEILTKRTMKDFFDTPVWFWFWKRSAAEGLAMVEEREMSPDTIIFCESVEHIARDEFMEAFQTAKRLLTKTHGRLIITNFIDFHPITPTLNGWDHVQRIDDALYDSLSAQASKVVFRRGSHLVLEF